MFSSMFSKEKGEKMVKTKEAEKNGLSYNQRLVRVIVSVLIMSLTGMSVTAADPLQQLMKLGGAYSNLTQKEQALSTAFIMDVGLSCSLLFGILASPFNKALGLKLSNLLGIILHTLGWILLIFLNSHFLYIIGAISFGLAFQLIVTSNLAMAGLIPEKQALIIGSIMAGCDFSLLIPHAILLFSRLFSLYAVVIFYLVVIVGGVAILGLIFIPTELIVYEESQEIAEEKEQLVSTQQDYGDASRNKLIYSPQQPESNMHHSLEFKKQILKKEYWIILIYFLIDFLRKKFMAISIREILKEIDHDKVSFGTANLLTNIFCYIVPYGFVFTLIWTLLMNRIGLTKITFLQNGLCCVYLFFLQVPTISLQAFTIILYLICQAFVYAHFLAYLTHYFGIKTLSASQGIASFITGAICLLLDTFLMPRLIVAVGTYKSLNMLYLLLSIGIFVCPIALMPRNKHAKRFKETHKV